MFVPETRGKQRLSVHGRGQPDPLLAGMVLNSWAGVPNSFHLALTARFRVARARFFLPAVLTRRHGNASLLFGPPWKLHVPLVYTTILSLSSVISRTLSG